jgi:hypothetical protein
VARFQDDDKPQWAGDIDITDLVPDFENEPSNKKKKKKKKEQKEDAEDGYGAVDMDGMDADVDEGWDGTEEMRQRKLDQYMDEIYELDFNDMVRAHSFCTWLTLIPLFAGGWDAHSIHVHRRSLGSLLTDPR